MSENVRVRFAPSPTGYLHVGGARSALFNYLFARHHGGTFVLRIEDTDRNRFMEGALKEIYESLKWLGITWDEGPECGGEYGPYIQSGRVELYRSHAEQLIERGSAYRCFCSAERLAEVRKGQELEKKKIGYDRHCRYLSKEEIQQKQVENCPYVIRFAMPAGRTIVFSDLIRGNIEYRSDLLDDFVLLKSDGYPTYHMAMVVDDHLMRISHVLRGDEWITSTPRHILLYKSFDWEPPAFAHLPVILSSDGGKLSKRKGAASVMDYKKAGYLPEALVNFLALLGWSPGNNREKMSAGELRNLFSLEQVSPKASVFDEKKLDWMNGCYMAERPVPILREEILPILKKHGVIDNAFQDIAYLDRVITLLRERSKRLTDLVDAIRYFFIDPVVYEEKASRKHFSPDAAERLELLAASLRTCPDFKGETIEKVFRNIAESLSISAGKLIHPVRLAVSGVHFGPGLFEMLETVGRETVLRRIDLAVKYIQKVHE